MPAAVCAQRATDEQAARIFARDVDPASERVGSIGKITVYI